jgi:uncharacterized protein (TIGR03118 family)
MRLLILSAVIALGAACGGGGGDDNSSNVAMVTLSVDPTSIALGETATLNWTASAGTACTASDGWSGDKADSGSEDVTPGDAGDVTYTLTCDGGGFTQGEASATLTVTAPTAFSATTLVSDTDGTGALETDAHLVNPWGIALSPTSSVWVANNHTASSTVYDGNGHAQPVSAPIVVNLPEANGVDFDATGLVFNATTSFMISSNGASAPATFIFDGEGGLIGGWSSAVDADNAVVMYADDGGAVYKGLAIANNGSGDLLYATDFFNKKVDVFDSTFAKQPAADFPFTDPDLPDGYAPFGIQALPTGDGGATQIYVSYAQQEPPDNDDEADGPGLGIVDVYDTDGTLVTQLIAEGGVLNAPWGMVLAPADFGTFSNMLLVGNFGDGRINAFDPSTGALVGTLAAADGTPFAVAGLWGMAFGNDANNQPHNTLFFAAGTNDEANGEFGRIDQGDTPPVLNAAPEVTVTAPDGDLSGTVSITADAQSDISIASVEFFADGDSLGVVTTPPYSVDWDTTTVADGSVDLTAKATDVDGNVGTSPAVTVTVANAPAATTLSEIQAEVFTPICSVCHDGSNPPGGALPGSQNLTEGNSFANLVNVASLEKPSLLRVKPGDPDNSYIIQKLEGAAGISGSRMPLGGPFLDDATMDKIRSWIADGAPNN